MSGSRRELFELLDKPALQPLPITIYEYTEIAFARVNIDTTSNLKDPSCVKLVGEYLIPGQSDGGSGCSVAAMQSYTLPIPVAQKKCNSADYTAASLALEPR
jgi:hypothetical protein